MDLAATRPARPQTMLRSDCDRTSEDAASLVAALGSAASAVIWVTTALVTMANVSGKKGGWMCTAWFWAAACC